MEVQGEGRNPFPAHTCFFYTKLFGIEQFFRVERVCVGGEGVEPVSSSRFNPDLTQFLSDCEMDLGSRGKSHISEWGGSHFPWKSCALEKNYVQ